MVNFVKGFCKVKKNILVSKKSGVEAAMQEVGEHKELSLTQEVVPKPMLRSKKIIAFKIIYKVRVYNVLHYFARN